MLLTGFLVLPGYGFTEETSYDPLFLTGGKSPTIVDLAVSDSGRNRDIPVRVYLPSGKSPSPVVLFSHGLGGSREGSAYLGRHWAGRGYVAVFLQHIGSDASVWADTPLSQRLSAMREAANLENFMLRVGDVSAVLDQLEVWNGADRHLLKGRLNTEHVGMSGHSFGAVTTQAVSGQRTQRGRAVFADPRIDAAIVMSPSSAKLGTPESAFGKVSVPWLLMTGTKDLAVIGDADMKSRLAVFPALPPGGKYELVLYDAEHSAFTERALPGDTEPRNPNHHRVILALSTAFWDAYLHNNVAAKKWLDGDGPKSLLETDDRWRKK
ncbi:MAG: dienelactone hydrolase [Acidobacteria bacterium]|nr:dienelactone hydrolase [Acidobacteriota bacterium]